MEKLTIVNAMLAAIGEDPVTDPESQHPSAVTARSTFDRITKSVQSVGWWYNKDYALRLSPSGLGEIILPGDTVAVTCSDSSLPYVQRGTKLYDPVMHTYLINAPVEVDLTIALPIEQVPEAVADYIAAYSVWQFYVDDDGDADKVQKYVEERERKRIAAVKENLRQLKLNIKNRPEVARLLGRIRPASSYLNSANPLLPGGGS